jgi:hypothetical protein
MLLDSSPEGRATRLTALFVGTEQTSPQIAEYFFSLQITAPQVRASPFGGSAERSEAIGGLRPKYHLHDATIPTFAKELFLFPYPSY